RYLSASEATFGSSLRKPRNPESPTVASTTEGSITVNPRYGYTSYGSDTNRTYDRAGNLTQDSKGSYIYDAKHRLVEADLTNGTKIEYGYDALDRRVEKRVTLGQTSGTPTFFSDGGNFVQEYVNGTPAREDILGGGLDQPLESRIYSPPNRDYTVFRDLRGSTPPVVADDGTVELFKYLP